MYEFNTFRIVEAAFTFLPKYCSKIVTWEWPNGDLQEKEYNNQFPILLSREVHFFEFNSSSYLSGFAQTGWPLQICLKKAEKVTNQIITS